MPLELLFINQLSAKSSEDILKSSEDVSSQQRSSEDVGRLASETSAII